MHPIKRERFRRGWSQTDLAAKVLVSRFAVLRWEHGKFPRPKYLTKLAQVFHIPVQRLADEILSYNAD
mgnify:CR=1